MDRIAQVIVEHSKRILVLTGVITFVALLMLFRMDFNADVAWHEARLVFHLDGFLHVWVTNRGGLTKPDRPSKPPVPDRGEKKPTRRKPAKKKAKKGTSRR